MSCGKTFPGTWGTETGALSGTRKGMWLNSSHFCDFFLEDHTAVWFFCSFCHLTPLPYSFLPALSVSILGSLVSQPFSSFPPPLGSLNSDVLHRVHSSFWYLGRLFRFLLSLWIPKGSGQWCTGPKTSRLREPNVIFRIFVNQWINTLATWNWPGWEYIYHGSKQML